MSFLSWYFLTAIVLDHAHLVCPIWLGWGSRPFREHMLARPSKFILLPASCVIGAMVIGVASTSTRDFPFRILAGVYVAWNAWHFGSQHFGVASLLGWRQGPRWMRQSVIIIPTVAVMLVPVGGLVMVIVGEVISFAHWVTDIGLTARVIRKWWWLIAVLMIGFIGFVWKAVTDDVHLCQGRLPVCTAVYSIPALLGVRYGLGFWHFLMSRWLWKLSDPQVRATIGRELFA